MAKLLKLRDRILLGVALIGDTFDELRLLGGAVSKKYEVVYGWIPPAYKRNSYYKSVIRLLKTGDIEKVVEKGRVVLRITNRGARRLIRDFPLVKITSKKWDGMWTVFMFDIEEVIRGRRDELRKRLTSLTFARLQKSVYITPHNLTSNLREWVDFLGLKGKVRIFRAKEVTGEELKDFVEKLWKVSKINTSYQDLLDEWETVRKLEARRREKVIHELKSKLLEVVINDPFLPRKLLPKDWVGDIARNKIGTL